MVSLSREEQPAGPVVTGFTENGFRVDGEEYVDGLWLTPEWSRNWNAPNLNSLDAGALGNLLAISPAPEFLILGTGATLQRPDPAFVNAIEGEGLGVEAMDSRAAARAWGVLRAEDRWIVAALLPFN